MVIGYLQTWFVPGQSMLLPFGIALLVVGFLLGDRVPKGTQGTLVVSSVLLFLILSTVESMTKSMAIHFVLLYFTGIAVSLLGGMLLRDIVQYFRNY